MEYAFLNQDRNQMMISQANFSLKLCQYEKPLALPSQKILQVLKQNLFLIFLNLPKFQQQALLNCLYVNQVVHIIFPVQDLA